MAIEATIDTARRVLRIELPLMPLIPSKTGKSRVVATTRGNIKTEARIDGHPVTIGVNAYIPVAS